MFTSWVDFAVGHSPEEKSIVLLPPKGLECFPALSLWLAAGRLFRWVRSGPRSSPTAGEGASCSIFAAGWIYWQGRSGLSTTVFVWTHTAGPKILRLIHSSCWVTCKWSTAVNSLILISPWKSHPIKTKTFSETLKYLRFIDINHVLPKPTSCQFTFKRGVSYSEGIDGRQNKLFRRHQNIWECIPNIQDI